ncbi:MAG: DUF3488 domain-containing protein [Nitrospira sp.]|nr:DUF3488 domain-containing protein [Nitrospira sp.]
MSCAWSCRTVPELRCTGPLYLRGVAYNRYDGKSWSNNLLHRRMLTELPQGTFTLRTPGAKPPPQARALRQDILLEPLDTAVLFGAPLAFAVKGDFHSVQSDLMGSLHLAFPSHSRIQYTVYSVPTSLNPAERAAAAVLCRVYSSAVSTDSPRQPADP